MVLFNIYHYLKIDKQSGNSCIENNAFTLMSDIHHLRGQSMSLNGGVPIMFVQKHEDSFSIVRWKTKDKNAKQTF